MRRVSAVLTRLAAQVRAASFAERAQQLKLAQAQKAAPPSPKASDPATRSFARPCGAATPLAATQMAATPVASAREEHWGSARFGGARLPAAASSEHVFYRLPQAKTERECRNNHRWCDLCGTDIPNANWASHLTGNLHSRNLFKVRALMLREEHNKPSLTAPPGTKLSPGHLWCTICSQEVPTDGWESHCAEPLHVAHRDERLAFFRKVVPPNDPVKHRYWTGKAMGR